VKDIIRFGYAMCWIEGGSNIVTRGKKFCGLQEYQFHDEWVGYLAWGSILCWRFKSLNVFNISEVYAEFEETRGYNRLHDNGISW
jgi:hypothetical protein